jgi:hydroxyacylglutathione hydrolase
MIPGEPAQFTGRALSSAGRRLHNSTIAPVHFCSRPPMLLRQIRDDKLAQYAYLVGCPRTGQALIIDPERDVDRYLAIAREEGLTLTAVTETHIHADFLSGARELARRGLQLFLSGGGGEDWSYRWPAADGARVTWLSDGDTFRVGKVEVRVLSTPGHTPEHVSFLITDRGADASEPMGLMTGDFVLVGDAGRPDLLESAAGVQGAMRAGAHALYGSAQRFLELPDYLQVWPGHGAGSACGKAIGAVPETTVGYERRFSPALKAAARGESAFLSYVLDGQPEPPPYFGRMKALNRDGPPLLDALPTPPRLTAEQLEALVGRTDVALVDTRIDRSAFMRRHLAGSLYAPLDKTFPTVMGSYVAPESPIYLLVSEEGLDDAVRSLVRVGLDRVLGWAPLELAETVSADGRLTSRIEEIDIGKLEERSEAEGTLAVDVRRSAEFEEGHLDGAVNVAHTSLALRSDELPRDRPLLLYCRTGSRSAVASAFLARQGFEAVYVNGRLETVLSPQTPA